jgi:hypothetical protein
MNTKLKHGSKPTAKKPKPNLHGPNSPTPKKKYKYDYQGDSKEEHVTTKTNEVSPEAE